MIEYWFCNIFDDSIFLWEWLFDQDPHQYKAEYKNNNGRKCILSACFDIFEDVSMHIQIYNLMNFYGFTRLSVVQNDTVILQWFFDFFSASSYQVIPHRDNKNENKRKHQHHSNGNKYQLY